MRNPGFSEKELVEDYILKELQKKGWEFVEPEALERESYEEPLLVPALLRAVKHINAGLNVRDDELARVVNELKLTTSGQEGAKRILQFYKFGVPVKSEQERVVQFVRLFGEKPEDNDFVVSRQVSYVGRERIRTDLMLFVNGIPIVNIECKDPTAPGTSWEDAYKQIRDYEEAVPELYKYVQIGAAAESEARYFPIVPWQKIVGTSQWREEDKDSIDSTVEMLGPTYLLDILKNFLFFRIERGDATKVITRYMQYRAANKIVNRVKESIASIESNESRGSEGRGVGRSRSGDSETLGTQGLPDSLDSETLGPKNRGLIWHWQGSGKTLTMIFAAHKLYYASELENPTIFFIVDRIELEEQLYTEFNALDMFAPEVVGSVEELEEILSADEFRGKRGVFITLIHKFRREELHRLQKKLEKASESRVTIANRKNVIAFVDEGHRTQYGTLAGQMKGILKSAYFFALTGTPIAKRGRDTFVEFSHPPEEEYLDRYFIIDSIQDGFTVKIAYQPRLESEHMKKDMLEAFLEMEEEEIPQDLREIVKERTRERLNVIKVFLENRTRIREIAKDIAQHYLEHMDGRFKAMVVAASRRACVLYKDALDEHLPREYSEIIMTSDRRDQGPLATYVREARQEYEWKEFREIVKDKVEKFREEELPKILIVTDMLLTGFDAPALAVMYLDKPLKEHRLLQAIARTNRPYKGQKEAGLILDYVGVLKQFQRALEMYSRKDVEHVLWDVNGLRQEFVGLLQDLKSLFGDLPMGYQRDTLLRAVEILTSDPQREEDFVTAYRSMRKLFELLGPDEIKLSHFEEFKWCSAIYTYYMKVVNDRPAVELWVQRFYDKTIRFIHKATEVEKIERDLPTLSIDAESLKRLDERVKNQKEKAASALFTLQRFVLVEQGKNPIYESLSERVEKLFELWREKTKDYKRIYSEASKLFKEAVTLTDRQKALGFTRMEYGMLLALEHEFGEKPSFVEDVRSLSAQLAGHLFPGWDIQTTVRKEIERLVRRFARSLKVRYRLTLERMEAIYQRLIDQVKNYGLPGHSV